MNNIDNEKTIRAIVSAYIEAYISGFTYNNILKTGTTNFLYSEYTTYNLLKKIAISLTTFFHMKDPNFKRKNYKELINSITLNELYTNTELWNSICKSKNGYSIVMNEYNQYK